MLIQKFYLPSCPDHDPFGCSWPTELSPLIVYVKFNDAWMRWRTSANIPLKHLGELQPFSESLMLMSAPIVVILKFITFFIEAINWIYISFCYSLYYKGYGCQIKYTSKVPEIIPLQVRSPFPNIGLDNRDSSPWIPLPVIQGYDVFSLFVNFVMLSYVHTWNSFF